MSGRAFTIEYSEKSVEAIVQPAPPEISAFIPCILVRCLDIRSVWSMGQDNHPRSSSCHELLAFADQPTLERLRKCDDLRRADVELLVVTDGDRFENAWGPRKLSGSLVRLGWRQVGPGEAYYDESRWADGNGNTGSVVRVRRRALLLWQSREALAA